jgi:hypothetical protein
MSLFDTFVRVSRCRPCPICGRHDWCLVGRDEPPSTAVCARVESPRRWNGAGWFHRLRDDGVRRAGHVASMRTLSLVPISNRMADLANTFRAAVEPPALANFALQMGVTTTSLCRLGIGRLGRAWSFPMTGRTGRVCGVRLRGDDGQKYAVRGSKEGLFVPTGLTGNGPLLLPEGPTDLAAALDLGFDAIGRPNCSGGISLVIGLVKRLAPAAVVVVADGDDPGQKGAAALARSLVPYCRDVRLVTPPVKDMREWLRVGATAAQVSAAIVAATPFRLTVSARRAVR